MNISSGVSLKTLSLVTFFVAGSVLSTVAPLMAQVATSTPTPQTTTIRYARCPDAQPYIDQYNSAYNSLPAKLGATTVENAKQWKLTNDRLISAIERCAERLHTQWKMQTTPPYEFDSIYYSGYLYEELATLDVFAMHVDSGLKGSQSLYVDSYSGETFEKMLYFEAAHACRSIRLATAAMMSPDATPVTNNASVAEFLTRVASTRINLDDLVRNLLPDDAKILSCEKDP